MRWKSHVRFGGSKPATTTLCLGDLRPNLLTTIIMPIALLANWNAVRENQISLLIILLLLETLLLAVFLVLDVLLFYIFFESILIPLFLLIGAKWFWTSLKCQQLSNFGNTLKLMVPNYCLKVIRGWVNYSCKVTSQKMMETKIGNREFKSILLERKCIIVKKTTSIR